jgi:hypothetical protein
MLLESIYHASCQFLRDEGQYYKYPNIQDIFSLY